MHYAVGRSMMTSALDFFQQTFLATRMTLNYNPEEEKAKYQVLLSSPEFIFGIFENLQNFGLCQIFEKCQKKSFAWYLFQVI